MTSSLARGSGSDTICSELEIKGAMAQRRDLLKLVGGYEREGGDFGLEFGAVFLN